MATKLFQRKWTMKQRQAAAEATASANGGVVVCNASMGSGWLGDPCMLCKGCVGLVMLECLRVIKCFKSPSYLSVP